MFKYALGMAALGMASALSAQTPPAQNPQPQQQQQQTQQATLPQGATAMRLDEGEQIRDTLGAILNSIVTDDEFSDVVDFESMVDHLAAPDRRRIGDVDADRLRQLTATVQSLKQAWQQRFNDDDLGDFDEDEVFRNIQLAEGRISNPSAFAANWPMKAGGAEMQGATGTTTDTPTGVGTSGSLPDKDTDIAVVTVQGGQGQNALTVSLINERFDRWRVDIPDSINAATLLSNLQRQLDAARQDSAKWPTDRDSAHRYLAHRVLMALYGMDGGNSAR